ncbi:ATP-dependent helicase [Herbaspirillum frisingense]|uniref:DNA 3'-5' helicase n=1 Tax=Herbaspirillum frisingense TaxID=92645 RepID=A0ABU1PEH5_9BURK|nr:ATP-dependent helicase [Herbaspirillum frisingense]MDR6584337.1 superfamily I DNA/RNA helicase [Herbaspirillum frisingense]
MSFTWTDRDLNPEQTRAVLEEGNVFLVACPGSGKTRTLTYKIARELSRLENPKQFLVAFTYTNRAAEEIHERIENLGIDTSQLWIGTIHSFCLEWILKPYCIYLPELAHGYRVIDAHEQERLLTEFCAQQGRVTFWDCGYYATEEGYELSCLDVRKHQALRAVYARYFTHLSDNRQIDFELILQYASKLIRSKPEIAKILSKLFPLVLVDEFQDTKRIQYSILAAILRVGGGTKIFIVGDPNQAIYGSLGGFAIPAQEFADMCQIELTELELSGNYRSSSRIIDYFSNYNVFPTQIQPASSDSAFPSTVSYNDTVLKDDLVEEVATLIQQALHAGISENEICILAPWWIQLAAITRRLVGLLPECNFDGPGTVPFSRDPENFWYQLSRIALTQASPSQYIRRTRWAAEVIQELDGQGIDVSRISTKILLRESNSIQLGERDGLSYLEQYFDELMGRLDIDWRAHALLAEHHQTFFDSSAVRIQKMHDEGLDFGDIDYFRKVFRHRTGITVNTIHGVKGAEFDVVIAFGLLEGMVPHFSDADGEASAKKMLYVVGSRARKHLHLIAERGRNRGGRYGQYSPTNVLARCIFEYTVR